MLGSEDPRIDEREQQYIVADADPLGFTECINRVERYSIELAARGKLPEQFIDEPATAERGTIAAYRAMKLLESQLLAILSDDDHGIADLSPQLEGLEGHTVEVVAYDGETRCFVVGRSDGLLPIHEEVADDRRPADRLYYSVVDLGIL